MHDKRPETLEADWDLLWAVVSDLVPDITERQGLMRFFSSIVRKEKYRTKYLEKGAPRLKYPVTVKEWARYRVVSHDYFGVIACKERGATNSSGAYIDRVPLGVIWESYKAYCRLRKRGSIRLKKDFIRELKERLTILHGKRHTKKGDTERVWLCKLPTVEELKAHVKQTSNNWLYATELGDNYEKT